MTGNKLTEMENERDAQRIFSLLREERDRLEEGICPPLPVCGLRRSKSKRLISPYWLVAASLIGFIVGIMIPTGDYADAPFNCIFAKQKQDEDTTDLDDIISVTSFKSRMEKMLAAPTTPYATCKEIRIQN